VLEVAHVDWLPPRRQPTSRQVVVATIASIVGSLVVDAALVVIGTHFFPTTKGYVHFRFSDYAKLTVIGVVIACAGWPIVTRITSTPRWLFFRLAIVVTAVLWAPDLWLLLRGTAIEAVLVLMSMHLAIALVTYNALVHLAPVSRRRRPLVDEVGQVRRVA